ncbi:MAG TPA: hypothetical protein VOB72_21190 [Candidatus Dormibacteraeota bacterium]|nr:hypothetical protein [Candidatus Dormibacteraeota bacterium]
MGWRRQASGAVAVDGPGLAPPPARPEPERDRYGRYRITDPVTGEERSWVRATTWAKTVSDLHALNGWEKRMVALGLAQRPDLLLRVAAVADPNSTPGKGELDRIIDQAREHAKASVRANLGTALHAFTESCDLGRPLPAIPPPFDRDIAAYQKAMAAVEVSRNYIERICVVRDLGVAGTMDRVVRFKHGRAGRDGRPLPLIADVKTGSDLKFSWNEIVIQLALYAHADTIYDPVTREHHPMLEVNRKTALVVHLPAGEGRCTLYLVDIAAGWEMAQLCGAVRAWRDRKDLAQPLVQVEPEGEGA